MRVGSLSRIGFMLKTKKLGIWETIVSPTTRPPTGVTFVTGSAHEWRQLCICSIGHKNPMQ